MTAKQQIKKEEIKDRLELAQKFYRAALSWKDKNQYHLINYLGNKIK